MAKNRKNQSAAIRFGPALKAVFLCLLIAGSAVGYVWQKSQIYQLGQQIRQREIAPGAIKERKPEVGRPARDFAFAGDARPAGARIESRAGSGAADAGLAAAGTRRRRRRSNPARQLAARQTSAPLTQ